VTRWTSRPGVLPGHPRARRPARLADAAARPRHPAAGRRPPLRPEHAETGHPLPRVTATVASVSEHHRGLLRHHPALPPTVHLRPPTDFSAVRISPRPPADCAPTQRADPPGRRRSTRRSRSGRPDPPTREHQVPPGIGDGTTAIVASPDLLTGDGPARLVATRGLRGCPCRPRFRSRVRFLLQAVRCRTTSTRPGSAPVPRSLETGVNRGTDQHQLGSGSVVGRPSRRCRRPGPWPAAIRTVPLVARRCSL
jgi:hypothetical protein